MEQEDTNFSNSAIQLQDTFQLAESGVCHSLIKLEFRIGVIIRILGHCERRNTEVKAFREMKDR